MAAHVTTTSPRQDRLRNLPSAGSLVAGKYEIDRVIGEGGMGVVFLAHHVALDQRVALKILLADAAKESGIVKRFVHEAQAAARLQSEHVTRVVDAGTLDNGLPFLAMEYLEGCDLAELLRLNGPLPVQEVVDFMFQTLEGLAHAHAAGIVHRDIKPSNVFLAIRPDGSNVIKILDFGISKSTSDAAGSKVKSLTGKAILGSPAYMSPEHVRNARSVDPRTDIWSLGVVMYELLSGALPFDGEGVGEILAAILAGTPPSLSEKRSDVPEGLNAVVFRCLERERDDRYASVHELAAALSEFVSPELRPMLERIEAVCKGSMRIEVPKLPIPTPALAISPLLLRMKPADAMRSPLPSEPGKPAEVAFEVSAPPLAPRRTLRETLKREWKVRGGILGFVGGVSAMALVAFALVLSRGGSSGFSAASAAAFLDVGSRAEMARLISEAAAADAVDLDSAGDPVVEAPAQPAPKPSPVVRSFSKPQQFRPRPSLLKSRD